MDLQSDRSFKWLFYIQRSRNNCHFDLIDNYDHIFDRRRHNVTDDLLLKCDRGIQYDLLKSFLFFDFFLLI